MSMSFLSRSGLQGAWTVRVGHVRFSNSEITGVHNGNTQFNWQRALLSFGQPCYSSSVFVQRFVGDERMLLLPDDEWPR